MQLQATGAIDEVQERRPALAASRGQAPGDAVGALRLGAGRQVRVQRLDLRDLLDPGEGVRERVDAGRAQLLELAPARGEDLRQLALLVRVRQG